MGVFVDKLGSVGILWLINFIFLNMLEFYVFVNCEIFYWYLGV